LHVPPAVVQVGSNPPVPQVKRVLFEQRWSFICVPVPAV
jgi:hypothetical protein